MNEAPVLKTTNLTYAYPNGARVINDVNITVEKGSIYGFLGPNGSGKTTTLSLLLGLMSVQQGKIEIFGKQVHTNRVEILRKTGALIESPSLYAHLSASGNLEIYRKLMGVPGSRVQQVLERVGLTATGCKKVSSFSLGMKQRLSLALALLSDPELLILDEPSNGLDPGGILDLRNLIIELNREQGLTILISSHLLSEVEKLATHIGIIVKGRLIFQGTLNDLQTIKGGHSRLTIQTSDNNAAFKLLHNYDPVVQGDVIVITIAQTIQIPVINGLLIRNGIDVYLSQPEKQNLEQLYIALTSTQP